MGMQRSLVGAIGNAARIPICTVFTWPSLDELVIGFLAIQARRFRLRRSLIRISQALGLFDVLCDVAGKTNWCFTPRPSKQLIIGSRQPVGEPSIPRLATLKLKVVAKPAFDFESMLLSQNHLDSVEC